MAHSDILIFLNSITWIFFLFLFVYFFLVLFFLPTFYKKVRIRSLIREVYVHVFVFVSSNSISNMYTSIENFRPYLADYTSLILYLPLRRFFCLRFSDLNFKIKRLVVDANVVTKNDSNVDIDFTLNFFAPKPFTLSNDGFFTYGFWIIWAY